MEIKFNSEEAHLIQLYVTKYTKIYPTVYVYCQKFKYKSFQVNVASFPT